MILRDGTLTGDPRADALEDFDPRSKSYPVRDLFSSSAPWNSRTWWCPIHLNQRAEGSCCGFAMTHELCARPHMMVKGRRFAREQIYWAAQRIDRWAGGAYPGADPYGEGTSVLAAVKIVKALGYITEYRWCFSLDDLVGCLCTVGPVVLGLRWYYGMSKPVDGRMAPEGGVLGRHAVLCKGVDVKRRLFKLHNSWGLGWGRLGDAWITWDDTERLLGEAGEACVPLTRKRGIL